MHWISIDTAMQVTGLAQRSIWRRVEKAPEWKRNRGGALKRAQVAAEAMIDDLLFPQPVTRDDLQVLMAADPGNPEAMNDIALLLMEMEQFDLAVKWLERAANAGHADAMHWMGRCLVAGHGVDIDTEQGLEWIRRSATAGHVISRAMIWQINPPDSSSPPPDTTLPIP